MERRDVLTNYNSNYKQLRDARKKAIEEINGYLKRLSEKYEITVGESEEGKISFSILGFQAEILCTILPIKETCCMDWYYVMRDPVEMKNKTILIHRANFNSPSFLDGRMKRIFEKLITFCEIAETETIKILGCED